MAVRLTPPILSESPRSIPPAAESARIDPGLLIPLQTESIASDDVDPDDAAAASAASNAAELTLPEPRASQLPLAPSQPPRQQRAAATQLDRAGRLAGAAPVPAWGGARDGQEQHSQVNRSSLTAAPPPLAAGASGTAVPEELLRLLRSRDNDLRAELNRAQQELEAARRDVLLLRKREQEQSQAETQRLERHQAQVEALRQQNQAIADESREAIQGWRQELSHVLERERELLQELEQAQLSLAAAHSHDQALAQRRQRQRSRLQARLLRFRATARELGAALDGARQQLEASRWQLVSLRKGHYKQGQSRARLQRRHQAQLEALQQENRTLAEQSSAIISGLQQDLTSSRRQLQAHDQELAAIAEMREQLNQDLSQQQELQCQLEQAQRDLAAARNRQLTLEDQRQRDQSRLQEELNSLHALLQDLPQIYETKFRQRLQPLLDQRNLLLQENAQLRGLLPGGAATANAQNQPRQLPQAAQRPRLRKDLQALFQVGSADHVHDQGTAGRQGENDERASAA